MVRNSQRRQDMMTKLPQFSMKCYACDAPAVGVRDRRPEGLELESACVRHADPTVQSYQACMYCQAEIGDDDLQIDHEFAHRDCHEENKNTGYIVRSAINPALVLCTDGEFRVYGVHTGPGTDNAVKVYKRRAAAEKVRGGVGITVEPV